MYYFANYVRIEMLCLCDEYIFKIIIMAGFTRFLARAIPELFD